MQKYPFVQKSNYDFFLLLLVIEISITYVNQCIFFTYVCFFMFLGPSVILLFNKTCFVIRKLKLAFFIFFLFYLFTSTKNFYYF